MATEAWRGKAFTVRLSCRRISDCRNCVRRVRNVRMVWIALTMFALIVWGAGYFRLGRSSRKVQPALFTSFILGAVWWCQDEGL